MVKEKEMICKNVLERVLKTEFSSNMFSLDGYAEDSVCLNKEDSAWEVYIGTRGNKNELEQYDNIISACLAVIKLLTPCNESLRAGLNDMFANAMIPDKIA